MELKFDILGGSHATTDLVSVQKKSVFDTNFKNFKARELHGHNHISTNLIVWN
jgi:hypothetical protein